MSESNGYINDSLKTREDELDVQSIPNQLTMTFIPNENNSSSVINVELNHSPSVVNGGNVSHNEDHDSNPNSNSIASSESTNDISVEPTDSSTDEDQHLIETEDDNEDGEIQNRCPQLSSSELPNYDGSGMIITEFSLKMQRRFYDIYCNSFEIGCTESSITFQTNEPKKLLVYVQHNDSIFSNILLYENFCSNQNMNYLKHNYIIWTCDVTCEYNYAKLLEVWENSFNKPFFNIRSHDDYPIVIGITPKLDQISEIHHIEYKLLVKAGNITDTNEEVTVETLQQMLVNFKET